MKQVMRKNVLEVFTTKAASRAAVGGPCLSSYNQQWRVAGKDCESVGPSIVQGDPGGSDVISPQAQCGQKLQSHEQVSLDDKRQLMGWGVGGLKTPRGEGDP